MKKVKALTAMCAMIVLAFMVSLASCDMAGLISSDLDNLGEGSSSAKGLSAAKNQKLKSILVTFDPKGGTVEQDSKLVMTGSSYGELPMPVRSGYKFGGWWTKAGGKRMRITASSTVTTRANQTLEAQWNVAPEKIVGTAVAGSTCFFFEFDVKSRERTARVLVPVSQDGYVQNGKMTYKEIIYKMPSFSVDYASGTMAGTTEEKDGLSYSFQGNYSPTDGFVGAISKSDNGAASGGYLVGTPMFRGMNVVNYVGAATYHFPTPTPQTLLFNATADFDTNEVVGTWCESGVGWGYGIHGAIGGTLNDDNTISLNAAPLPAFEPYLQYPLSVLGEGSFDDTDKKTVSGYLNLYYGDMVLPSTIVAVRESDLSDLRP
ncbi:MAG TPA: InlB B-repeat-containing protein [Rectinemataceae bacterium]|nr:InlB B-repeat-containing protein [Rectinemataceae bacterium]